MSNEEPVIFEQRTNGVRAAMVGSLMLGLFIGAVVLCVQADRTAVRLGCAAFAVMAGAFFASVAYGFVRPRSWLMMVDGDVVAYVDSARADAETSLRLATPRCAEVTVIQSESVDHADTEEVRLVGADESRWLVPREVYSSHHRFVQRLESIGFQLTTITSGEPNR